MKYFFDFFNKILIDNYNNKNNNDINVIEYDCDEVLYNSDDHIYIYDLNSNKHKKLTKREMSEYLIAHNLLEFDFSKQFIDENGKIIDKSESDIMSEQLNERKKLLKNQIKETRRQYFNNFIDEYKGNNFFHSLNEFMQKIIEFQIENEKIIDNCNSLEELNELKLKKIDFIIDEH